MHQVLYRKWRPKTFTEVLGQSHITDILRYETAHNKAAHAYLFYGSRGTGKTTCAKLLARAVNCENLCDGEPCGRCEACVSIDNGTATDVLEMDAASNNGIDDIRAIRDEVMYPPAALKNRVYIIDEVHMLSISAFNALLKTLEEPPPQVIFILATTELQKIPATIISRCRRFDFRRIAQSDIASRLSLVASKEGFSLDPDAAQLIARAAQGGMRDALGLLELCAASGKNVGCDLVYSATGMSGYDTVAKVVAAVAQRKTGELFASVAEVYNSSKDIAVFWQELISFYRDMLVVKSTKSAVSYLDLTPSEFEILKESSALLSRETILWHCSLLDEAYISMQRNIISKRLCAELTLVRMASKPDDSPASLTARIAALEDAVFLGSVVNTVKLPEEKPENAAEAVLVEKIKTEKPNGSGEAPGEEHKKGKPVLRNAPYWIEVVKKFQKTDAAVGAMLTDSAAYKEENEKTLYVRLKNKLAPKLLDKPEIKELLLRLCSQHGDENIGGIVFEVQSEKSRALPIDEIDTGL